MANASPGRRRRKKVCGNLAARGAGDLNGVLTLLEGAGRLISVRSTVDPHLELGGVALGFHGKDAAVRFSSVEGSPYPVLTGIYWNRDLLGSLFGMAPEELPFHIAGAVAEWQQKPLDPVVSEIGPVKEVVEEEPNLEILPIPQVGTEEGGPYLTSSIVIGHDPDTGTRNASIMRFMVTGPQRLTCLMDIGRHLRDYYERAEARGESLPITINNGVGPAVHFASVIPASAAPLESDELGIASHLLGEPLALAPASTVDGVVIADAQFVVEGRLLPDVREPEGPAAEVTGYYASRERRWVVEVTGLTRRTEPIWHTIMPGREVFNAVGLTAEAGLYRLISGQVPAVRAVHLTYGGCGFYHAVLQLDKNVEGIQRNAIHAAFAAFPSLKQVIAVDEDVDIYNPEDVEWALATRFDPARDIMITTDARCHELNPVTDNGVGAKMGLDATTPHPRPWQFRRMRGLEVDLADYDIDAPGTR